MKYNDYVHGSHNVICDRSGFKVKAGQTRLEWNGSRVRLQDWERRHPQDFLRAVSDSQAVDNPRPGATDTFSETETSLDADELPGQTVISVASTANMVVGISIIIFMDNEIAHLSTIQSFSANDTVTIVDSLPSKASSGNIVIVYDNQTQESDL